MSWKEDKDPFSNLLLGRIIGHYRTIWNLGPKIVVAQEIANDLNAGAVHRDRGSHGPTRDGWTLATL